MEQMYLVEMFIDKVTVFASEGDTSAANKKLIIKLKFGPKDQFIIKEGQLAVTGPADDIITCDDQGHRKWTRTIRVGKSFLFPSYPDTVMMILKNFPLEIEVWNDDENEVEIFVGIGTMQWDTQFFHMLRESTDACKPHDPLSIKQLTPLFAECCCGQVGEIAFILRLSALGETIITEFQQLMKTPDSFVFRTNKAPSMFKCSRIEGDDPNFCMLGSLYETTTLEDPDVVNNAENKIEVCTELQSCGVGAAGTDYTCAHGKGKEEEGKEKKTYPIDKIKMGDITGPCGNTNCPLAHKIRTYIRTLDTYKQKAKGVSASKGDVTKKVCGTCDCKDDKWHRDECPDKSQESKATCSGCGGITKSGDTCNDRKQKLLDTETKATNYVLVNERMFGRDYTVENMVVNYDFQKQGHAGTSQNLNQGGTTQNTKGGGCCCRREMAASAAEKIKSTNTLAPSEERELYQQYVYNFEMKNHHRNHFSVYNCTDIPDDKDCKCAPPKPTPPCKTFDCDCITEAGNIQARKQHKPYCPSYKHKSNCPVNLLHENEEDKKKQDEDEDEAEPLPYGLPPIQLGPCPVLGRPCSVPDGFARMYKTAALPALPPSYSDDGKVCCSKEYERIKKAIKEYMTHEKDHDFRCINKFDVDTERRCCDKEQRLMALTGKSCCGSHKMAIQEKYKEN